MSILPIHSISGLLVALAGLAPAALFGQFGQEQQTDTQPFSLRVGSTGANVRILDALEEETDFNFIETPLADVATFISEAHEIPIRIDTATLSRAGLDADVPLSVTIRGVSLRSGLKLLLDEQNLGYYVDDGILVITIKEAAQAHTVVRIYELRGKSAVETSDLARLLQSLLSDASPRGPAARQADPAGGGMRSDVITTNRLRVVPYQNYLLVRANMPMHDEVTELLQTLVRLEQQDQEPGRLGIVPNSDRAEDSTPPAPRRSEERRRRARSTQEQAPRSDPFAPARPRTDPFQAPQRVGDPFAPDPADHRE